MKKEYAVFIGRFQPIHKGHMTIIKEALNIAEKLIIVIGTSNLYNKVKNPFDIETRKYCILQTLLEEYNPQEINDRISFIYQRDFMYSDNQWIINLQNKIAVETNNSNSVVLFGAFKDDSSTYLNYFPQWELKSIPLFYYNNKILSSNDIRSAWYENNLDKYKNIIAKNVYELMIIHNGDHSIFISLQKEYNFIKDYKKKWDNAPYPPTFVTVDAVVIQSGHVLLIKRKSFHGEGLYALPGGFLNNNELIIDGCIRELYEETKIDIPKVIMRNKIIDSKVFDHPNRSERGRTISHAFLFELDNNKPLPKVKGGDDAQEALWMPFNDVMNNENDFFEDHFHIINCFILK
jgi:bifunctional NMN adenylyltransferase/nudix hydrolase